MMGTPIALPTAAAGAQRALTFAGSSTSEGGISLSADGHYVVMAGYDAAPGTASVAGTTAATVNRVVGRLDAMGNVDTSTALNAAFNTSNVRAAASSDGTNIWVSGTSGAATGGVHYTMFGTVGGTQVLAAPNNTRWVGVFGGQLYATSGSGTFVNVFSVGNGLPTTAGQTGTPLPGMPTASGLSPYGFVFFDLNAGVAGIDTLYVGDDRTTAQGGGIQKWTFDGATWTKVATFTPPDMAGTGTIGARAVTGFLNNGMVTLIAVTGEMTGAPTRIVSVTDDGTMNPAFTVLVNSPTNTVYRGVALSPK